MASIFHATDYFSETKGFDLVTVSCFLILQPMNMQASLRLALVLHCLQHNTPVELPFRVQSEEGGVTMLRYRTRSVVIRVDHSEKTLTIAARTRLH